MTATRPSHPTARSLGRLVTALTIVVASLLASAPPGSARPQPIVHDAAWSIYMDPKVYTTSKATYIGSVRSNGDVEATRVRTSDSSIQHTVLERSSMVDDHAAPGIVETPSGRVAYFWSGHNNRPVHYRVSATSGSLTTMSSIRTLRGSGIESRRSTYAQVVRLPGESRPYHLLTRLDDGNWWLTRSSDLRTWSPAIQLTRDSYPNPASGSLSPHFRPYIEVAGSSWRTLHIGITTGYTTSGSENSLYYLTLSKGALVDGSGKVLRTASQVSRLGRGVTPLDPREATRVTPWAGERRVQVFDLSVVAGTPSIGSSTYVADRGEHTVDVATARRGRWSAASLTRLPTRPQSIALDQRAARTAYVTLPRDGGSDLYRYTSTGPEEAWHPSAVHAGAPQIWTPASAFGPGTGPGTPQLFWMRGHKTSVVRWTTDVWADVPARAPIQLTARYARRPAGGWTVHATTRKGVRGAPLGDVTVRVRYLRKGSSTWRTITRGTGSSGVASIALPVLPRQSSVRVDTVPTTTVGYGSLPTRTL